MRKWIAGVLATVALFAAIVGWNWRAASAQEEAVTGRVVCLVCYTRDAANTGHDHDDGFACARACVRWEGNPAGLVTTDGNVYQFVGGVIANNNEKISEFLTETVRVRGKVYESAGMTMIDTNDVTRVTETSK